MWNEAYLESKVLSAAPVELVGMLYEGALEAVSEARECLGKGDIAGRSRAITKALQILYELTSALDHERGGELSRRLAGLYAYMQQRLIDANVEQAEAPLVEIGSLLATLEEAWRAVPVSESEAVAGVPAEAPEAWCAPAQEYAPSQAWSL